MSKQIMRETIKKLGRIALETSPRPNSVANIRKLWYIETIKLFINETWLGIVGEAIRNCLFPLWKSGADPWKVIPDDTELNSFEVNTDFLTITLVVMYQQYYGFERLATLLISHGNLHHQDSSEFHDEYVLVLNDGLSTLVNLYVYNSPENYKPSLATEALLFNRLGWQSLEKTVSHYHPLKITPVFGRNGDTNDCPTNQHRSVLNLLSYIENKEIVPLNNPENSAIIDHLNAGWISNRFSGIDYSKIESQEFCRACGEEICGWFAEDSMADGQGKYHPACIYKN